MGLLYFKSTNYGTENFVGRIIWNIRLSIPFSNTQDFFKYKLWDQKFRVRNVLLEIFASVGLFLNIQNVKKYKLWDRKCLVENVLFEMVLVASWMLFISMKLWWQQWQHQHCDWRWSYQGRGETVWVMAYIDSGEQCASASYSDLAEL